MTAQSVAPAAAVREPSWHEVLTRLEGDLDHTEQLLALIDSGCPVDDWVPVPTAPALPLDLGSLPEHLVLRARHTLQRMRDLRVHLVQSLASTARHQALVVELESSLGAARRPPVFVDVSA